MLDLLWRVFIIYLLIFLNPAWGSNFRKLCKSRVNIFLQDMSTFHCLKVLRERFSFLFFHR